MLQDAHLADTRGQIKNGPQQELQQRRHLRTARTSTMAIARGPFFLDPSLTEKVEMFVCGCQGEAKAVKVAPRCCVKVPFLFQGFVRRRVTNRDSRSKEGFSSML
jgi:hypothetical protein